MKFYEVRRAYRNFYPDGGLVARGWLLWGVAMMFFGLAIIAFLPLLKR